jgi:DNA polymerase III alpha subunit
LKKAFQSLAGAYGIEFKDRMRLSKRIEQDDEDPTQFILPEEVEENHPDLHAQLERLAGIKCQVSAHPAGVIIADPAVHLRAQVPEMFIPSSKRFVGQYDLFAAEDTGLMKQDFLGLRALDTIAEAVRLVEWRTGERLDPDSWVPDSEPGDDEVWKMIRQGRTEGVFQMEGFTNQRGCKAVKPKNFEDVVSVTALYRTGPIKAKFPEMFIANRQAGKIKWAHPALEQFLGQTWGVILYQEQVMDIAQHLAGFDAGRVDDIVKSIKHKDPAKMEVMRPMFMKGCKDTGIIGKDVAKYLWDAIEGYSGYSYNRSHAVAYTMTTYQTARLKRHHTVEFIAALLATVEASKDNAEKREAYLREAVRMGIKILPPDINKSGVTAMPNKKGTAIRFGLTDVTGIGTKAALKIIQGRPKGGYTKAAQVAEAVNNAGTFNLLMESNIMKSIGVEGSITRLEELLRWQLRDRLLEIREEYNEYLDPPETAHDYDDVCILGEVISKVEGHTKGKPPKRYQTWRIRMSPTQTYAVRLWSETEAKWTIPEGTVVLVRGRWEPKWENLGVASPKMIKVVRRAGAVAA